MTLMQWILIGIGGVLFLTGAILLLIGIIKKKSLVLWKLLPGAVILCGLVLAGVVGLNFMGQQQLTQRENYVASRLIELESYAPAQLAAETALNRSPNVQSAQLAVLSLALEGRYSQGEQAAWNSWRRFARKQPADKISVQTCCKSSNKLKRSCASRITTGARRKAL